LVRHFCALALSGESTLTAPSSRKEEDFALSFGVVRQRVRSVLKLSNTQQARIKLTQLLRSGELRGFVFLPGKAEVEVIVPIHFWRGVKSGRFQTDQFDLKLHEIADAAGATIAQAFPAVGDSLSVVVAKTIERSRANREVCFWQSTLD